MIHGILTKLEQIELDLNKLNKITTHLKNKFLDNTDLQFLQIEILHKLHTIFVDDVYKEYNRLLSTFEYTKNLSKKHIEFFSQLQIEKRGNEMDFLSMIKLINNVSCDICKQFSYCENLNKFFNIPIGILESLPNFDIYYFTTLHRCYLDYIIYQLKKLNMTLRLSQVTFFHTTSDFKIFLQQQLNPLFLNEIKIILTSLQKNKFRLHECLLDLDKFPIIGTQQQIFEIVGMHQCFEIHNKCYYFKLKSNSTVLLFPTNIAHIFIFLHTILNTDIINIICNLLIVVQQ